MQALSFAILSKGQKTACRYYVTVEKIETLWKQTWPYASDETYDSLTRNCKRFASQLWEAVISFCTDTNRFFDDMCGIKLFKDLEKLCTEIECFCGGVYRTYSFYYNGDLYDFISTIKGRLSEVWLGQVL